MRSHFSATLNPDSSIGLLIERANGHRIFYGDVRRPNADQCRTLRTPGASLVVSENLETSLELAREALIRDDGDADEAETLILRFRDSHYDDVDSEKPKETSNRSKV